jgi:hypothetical protein
VSVAIGSRVGKSARSRRPRRERSAITAALPSAISTSKPTRRCAVASQVIAAWIGRVEPIATRSSRGRLVERCSARASCQASTIARACGRSF